MNKKIDLSDIKENDMDKTSSFTDLMTRKEKRNRSNDVDIEDMLEERKKSTKDLTKDLKKATEEYNKNIEETNNNLEKTQILELTRQMKFNFEEKKEEINHSKRKIISPLNVIGEVNLLCIGYYIYLLAFTNYQDKQTNYMITGSIIVLFVLLFGLSVITNKKVSKFFNILNIFAILGFIAFNTYTLLY